MREANLSDSAFEPKDAIQANAQRGLRCLKGLIMDWRRHFLNAIDVVAHIFAVEDQRSLKPFTHGVEKRLGVKGQIGCARADKGIEEPPIVCGQTSLDQMRFSLPAS